MTVIEYDIFGGAFLSKISEYDFIDLFDDVRTEIVDGYLKRAIAKFKKNCKYDFTTAADDENRIFNIEVEDDDIDEIVDIVSEGMIAEWMHPFIYKQELLQNMVNTRDFTLYSPAELLKRVSDAYTKVQNDYKQMIREYSYNHGDLEKLHS